jgi:P27 family predicted phage terminase small subunit
MVRGRKPLATTIKESSGALKKNPQRRNKSEPKAKPGHPEMPAIVAEDKEASECWREVCDTLSEMGVLTTADKALMIAYCLDYSQFVHLWHVVKGGNVTQMNQKTGVSLSPEAGQIHKYADRILKRQAELGLTPSSRSRLHVAKQEEENPFQEWLRGASDN